MDTVLFSQTLGKVGRVVQVYADGDLKVAIRDVMWTFNPRNVSRLEGDGVPLTPGTSGKGERGGLINSCRFKAYFLQRVCLSC